MVKRCSSDNIQILAPAGSIEQLKLAVNNGCDAVYLGLESFNARMKAPNFTLQNLTEWVDYCHLFSVKVYVAINTSLKNDEFAQAVEMLVESYKNNVDGVIVTDIALMQIAGTLPKPFDVVASTQLNVHDKYGAEFVKKHGASTVVCARECSIDDIKAIASTDIGVECFLHGAMCVSQSGQCLFSSMVGGNSGNRGLCSQPCRKLYFAEGCGLLNGYLLSAHDINSLKTAEELVKAGATTFKIEGRNRRAEYAGLTSRIYKHLFDNDFKSDKGDYLALAEMYNRGMVSNGYLESDNSDIIFSPIQNHSGVFVGTISGDCVSAVSKIRKGDGLKVFDRGREICGGIALEDGDRKVKVRFSGIVKDGMRVHRTTSVELCNSVSSARRRLFVKLRFEAKAGSSAKIYANCNGVDVLCSSDFIVQKSQKVVLTKEEITLQLRKTGETHFTISDIDIEIGEIFIPKSQINALRRDVLECLSYEIIEKYNSRFAVRKAFDLSPDYLIRMQRNSYVVDDGDESRTALYVVCYNERELHAANQGSNCLVYKPKIIDGESFAIAKKYDAFMDLPSFVDMNYIDKLIREMSINVFCNNLGQIEFARQRCIKYIAGGGLNIFNDDMSYIFNDSETFVYSRELTLKEIEQFQNSSGIKFVDGQLPLMQLCHCPFKVACGCDCSACKGDEILTYRDELNNRFKIRRRKGERCYFELFNGSKLSVVNRLGASGRYLIDFNSAVVKHYENLNHGFSDGYSETEPYTKGRLYDKIN